MTIQRGLWIHKNDAENEAYERLRLKKTEKHIGSLQQDAKVGVEPRRNMAHDKIDIGANITNLFANNAKTSGTTLIATDTGSEQLHM